MKIPVYKVDAFSAKLFGGNPAAVCPLQNWLSDELMQKIAMENNLSETAFYVNENDVYHIRWFTPGTEIALCGHATLATAHVMFNHLNYADNQINFTCKSGPLKVTRQHNGNITLNFPANPPQQTIAPQNIFEALGIAPAPVYNTSFDYMVVLQTQQQIEALQPDFKLLATVKARGVIVTAPGNESDFVSRCFYPQSGIDEDPVTGSAHTITTVYWATQLQKNKMKAIQLSARRGMLEVELQNDRVLMTGQAITFMTGEIYI
jgi:PhzF family phenazine biosynthesis protein